VGTFLPAGVDKSSTIKYGIEHFRPSHSLVATNLQKNLHFIPTQGCMAGSTGAALGQEATQNYKTQTANMTSAANELIHHYIYIYFAIRA
jgi:hypothetical protein